MKYAPSKSRDRILAEELADAIGPVSTRRDRVRIILEFILSHEDQPLLYVAVPEKKEPVHF